MAPPEKSTEHLPQPTPKRRARVRRLVVILGVPTIVFGGWKAAPLVRDRVRLYLAERAIDEGRYEEAEARLDLLIAEKPARTRPRFLKARLAREQGHITEAEEVLQRAVELGLPVEQARVEHDLLRGEAVSGQLSAISLDKNPADGDSPNRR
jgi:tetratricopeptide (TPR) repeat protein